MDIDSDFDIERGGEVFDHIIKKYGKDHVANVITFGKMQMKMVIKDLARAFKVPVEEANAFTKNIPEKDAEGNEILHVENLKDIPGAKEFFTKYPDIYRFAIQLEGLPRQTGQHPAGIGVTSKPITDLIPVQLAKDTGGVERGYLSQYEKDQFEQSGVVKIDILKLKAATQLQQMYGMIEKYYQKQVKAIFKSSHITDINIPEDDDKAWDILCAGDTLGIFQMESVIAIPALHKVKPRNITELAAVTSFIRPGAVGLNDYVKAKKDPSCVKKIDPRIDAILAPNYGTIPFQETIDFPEKVQYRTKKNNLKNYLFRNMVVYHSNMIYYHRANSVNSLI